VIHLFARMIQRIPRRRERVARMVSPETRLWVSPASKAASEAISKVHRLLSYPNSLGERCSIPRSRSAESASTKAAYTCFGTGEPGVSASRPLSLKARMALRTVCEAHPRFAAILGGEKDLAAAHHEGFPGAQPRFESLALLLRQFPDKYWRFHRRNYSPSHTTLSEEALERRKS
jgi:hypothetical protein